MPRIRPPKTDSTDPLQGSALAHQPELLVAFTRIYGTLWSMKFEIGHDDWHEVTAQAVPNHIDDTGPAWAFLPPPIPVDEHQNGRAIHRAVVFVDETTEKGTERCGQEYVDPLLTISGREYRWTPFPDLQDRLENILIERHGPL